MPADFDEQMRELQPFNLLFHCLSSFDMIFLSKIQNYSSIVDSIRKLSIDLHFQNTQFS